MFLKKTRWDPSIRGCSEHDITENGINPVLQTGVDFPSQQG